MPVMSFRSACRRLATGDGRLVRATGYPPLPERLAACGFDRSALPDDAPWRGAGAISGLSLGVRLLLIRGMADEEDVRGRSPARGSCCWAGDPTIGTACYVAIRTVGGQLGSGAAASRCSTWA